MAATDIGNRPLTASDADAYVLREVDSVVDAAIDASQHVLLATGRGGGATSLLYRLENRHPDAVYVNAEFASTPADLLAALSVRLGVAATPPSELTLGRRDDPLAAPPALAQLRVALEEAGRRPLLLIDGPIDPAVAFDLFGRWRDEVFAVPAQWVVVAHETRLAEYLTQPADVFFDRVVGLEPLDEKQAFDLLDRRDILGALTPAARHAAVDAFDGTPRHLILLSRPRLGRAAAPDREQAAKYVAATQSLSRGARAVLTEIQGRGPVSATDSELQHRLGLGARQLRRNLAELHEAGLLKSVAGSRGGPGRPPLTFRLSDLGEFDAVRR